MENRMNVLMLNGSPRTNGNIALAFQEMEQVFRENGIGVENIQLGKQVIRGCIACESCRKTHKCVFDDIVNKLAEKFEAADGLVIGSPVYFGSANGTLMSALQRLFYSTSFDKSLKVGASVVSATSSSRWPICRWPPASTGTTSTAGSPEKAKRTRKAAR